MSRSACPISVHRSKSCAHRELDCSTNRARAREGHLYVFVHPSSTGGVLLELIQE